MRLEGSCDQLAPVEDAPSRGAGGTMPMDRLQRRRLAGAVAAQQRHHLALADGETHAVENVRFAVPGVEILDAQQLLRDGRPPQAWPVPI